MTTKRIILAILTVAVIGLIVFLLFGKSEPKQTDTATTTPDITQTDPAHNVIGTSVEGNDIDTYTYGNGDTHIAFVGGIHGGYEWNTVLLSRQLMNWFEQSPSVIPENVQVTVIPVLNPDGLQKIVGTAREFSAADAPSVEQTAPGRFNANGVDLNRNFDCNWQPESTWRGESVDAGSAAFSEPEAEAMRQFVQDGNPDAVIFFHSAAGAVYGSACNNGILPGTVTLMNTYANAAGYRAIESFDAYPITGDAEGWLAKLGIPSVSVELTTHEDVEWEKNKAGIQAVLQNAATAR